MLCCDAQLFRCLLIFVAVFQAIILTVRSDEIADDSSKENYPDWDTEELESRLCGSPSQKPKLTSVLKIIRGNEAVSHSWPWQVQLLNYGEHECGGTLVNESFVLTAAHCLPEDEDTSGMVVVLGEHNIYKKSSSRVEIPVYRASAHPFFDPESTAYDIGLIELEFPATLTNEVIPICLPMQNEGPPTGTTCYITGWGATKDRDDALEGDGTDMSAVLRQAPTTILSPARCENFFGETIMPESVICGTSTRGDTCQGDSGGPLQCQTESGTWYLAGITSWGWKCGKGTPAVYTRVSKYLDWYDMETNNW